MNDRQGILDYYNNTCLKCHNPARDIHEIIPKSSGKRAMRMSNRISLCPICHTWAHKFGTNYSEPLLKQLQIEYILEHGYRYNKRRK